MSPEPRSGFFITGHCARLDVVYRTLTLIDILPVALAFFHGDRAKGSHVPV